MFNFIYSLCYPIVKVIASVLCWIAQFLPEEAAQQRKERDKLNNHYYNKGKQRVYMQDHRNHKRELMKQNSI